LLNFQPVCDFNCSVVLAHGYICYACGYLVVVILTSVPCHYILQGKYCCMPERKPAKSAALCDDERIVKLGCIHTYAQLVPLHRRSYYLGTGADYTGFCYLNKCP